MPLPAMTTYSKPGTEERKVPNSPRGGFTSPQCTPRGGEAEAIEAKGLLVGFERVAARLEGGIGRALRRGSTTLADLRLTEVSGVLNSRARASSKADFGSRLCPAASARLVFFVQARAQLGRRQGARIDCRPW